ncbi:hypothetical protein OH492_20390 [Vibrio chagasii]|nr:hypothetical protein [Vibrio chagasii]
MHASANTLLHMPLSPPSCLTLPARLSLMGMMFTKFAYDIEDTKYLPSDFVIAVCKDML